jgi:tetratricopeptide (TPR) repeat protein
MRRKNVIETGMLTLLLAVTALGRASMYEHTEIMSEGPQRVTRPWEEFEKLAIRKVQGEAPELLRGVWLDRRIYRVEVTVGVDGDIIETYPLAGDALLAEAALVAAKQWKFPPQIVNGKPVHLVSAVNVEFRSLEPPTKPARIEIAKQDLQAHPDNPRGYYNLGFAYLMGKQYKEACSYFQQAVERAPAWPVAYAALGDAYYGSDQYEEAIRCFHRATTLKQDYFESYKKTGWCYVRLGRELDAVIAFRQAAERAKSADDKVGVYRNLVSSYEALGKNEEAASAQMQVASHAARYCSVAKHPPFDTTKEAFLAAVKYERLRETDKALAAYRLAMDIDPLTEPALLARITVAEYLRRENELDQATRLLEGMVQLANGAIRDYGSSKDDYGLGSAYYWRGSARRDLGQLQLALEDLVKAVRYRPEWGEAHLRLAYLHLQLGNARSARKEYQTSGIIDEKLARQLANQNKDRN